MPNPMNSELESLYDRMACEFLQHGWDGQTMPPPDGTTVAAMRENIPKDEGGRTPGKCDVLTTYIPIDNEDMCKELYKIRYEVKKVLGDEFDCYEPPEKDFHISLVMLHDVRPVDWNNERVKSARIDDDKFEEIKCCIENALVESDVRSYSLNLYGIRFSARDGAVMGVFLDNGETRHLRNAIGKAVSQYVNRELLKYDKPFIHVTLLRPMDVFSAETVAKLRRKQREYFCFANGKEMQVDSIVLGKETQWMHANVTEIGKFPLQLAGTS